MVAEMGFEPHDLRVMSPTSYQTAPLRDIIGAGSRGRTGTRVESHGILSPGRLPIPPFRHIRSSVLPNYYSTNICNCQPFFLDFLKNPAIRLDNRAQMCYHYMRLCDALFQKGICARQVCQAKQICETRSPNGTYPTQYLKFNTE